MLHLSRSTARRMAVAVVLPLLLAGSMATSATAAVPAPPTPSGLPTAIEQAAPYVPADSCDSTVKPGALKLAKLLKKTYPKTSYGIARTCGARPNSEHLEGRAIDWMNSVRNPTQARQAQAVLSWLLATDQAGHPQANVRRLGVMYLIWNNRIWSAYRADQGWRPYLDCATRTARAYDAYCHRNHIHISLSWEGAMGRTSFWSKSVADRDYGPCRLADLNWAAPRKTPNPVPCASYPRVVAAHGASATKKSLVTYSGIVLRSGSSGTAVKTVQKVVKASTRNGHFDAKTTAAVKRWQTSHGLHPNGVVNASTWRTLLQAVR